MYHLIYLEQALLLSKYPYRDWLEIQAAHPTYKTSLGPWTLEEVLEFLRQEYPDLPAQEAEIEAFAQSDAKVLSL